MRCSRFMPVLVCVSLGPLIAPYAAAQTIGLYSDVDCQSTTLSVPFPGLPVDLYVMYSNPEGSSYLDEAEFKIYGLPNEWEYEVIPGALVVEFTGDPVRGPAARVRLSACMNPGCIELARIRVTPTRVIGTRQVLISGEDNDDVTNCPWTLQCGARYVTCLTDTRSQLNPGTTAVSFVSWGTIKVLFK